MAGDPWSTEGSSQKAVEECEAFLNSEAVKPFNRAKACGADATTLTILFIQCHAKFTGKPLTPTVVSATLDHVTDVLAQSKEDPRRKTIRADLQREWDKLETASNTSQ